MMTRFEIETGLREKYRSQFEDFKSGLRSHEEEIGSTLVKVLLWGPGKYSNRHYEKRKQILEYLQSTCPANDIATSELLEEEGPDLSPYLSLRDREELHAQAADLIFILLVSEHQVTGPEAEVLSFAHDKILRGKMWIFLPKGWDKSGYLAQAVKDFPAERKKQYTFPQIRDCSRIRSFCNEKIREIRGQKFMELQRLRRMVHG